MPAATKATLLTENEIQRRRILELEAQLAACQRGDESPQRAPAGAERDDRLFAALAELTRANAALEASQATLQGFYDSAPFMMGIAELDGDKTVAVSANRATAEFLAMPPKKVPGQSGVALGNPAEFERLWVETYRRCQREGQPAHFEYAYPHINGSRWLRATTAFIGFGPTGNPRFSFVVEDSTARKQTEEALRLAATITENKVDGANMIRASDGAIIHVNARFSEMFGYASDELIGQNVSVLNAPGIESPDDVVARITAYLDAQDAWRGDVLNRRKDGSTFWSHASIVTFEHPQHGKVWISFQEDITARRQAEDALRQMNDTLEQQVMERTAELRKSHAQTQALSRQMIETQENERRAIGRELHDEIGQTLTGLTLLLEMAQRLPPEANRAKLKQAQAVAGELIDRVSALSLDLRPPMLDDLGLLPTLRWFVERYASQTSIRVDFHHRGLKNRRFAPAIETAVYRLVQESLTNVGRHAQVDMVSVRVVAGKGTLDIYVEDAGAGFDVHSVLERSDSSGLSGMRERVNLLEGTLAIDAAPGHGTRVTIRLPSTPQESHR